MPSRGIDEARRHFRMRLLLAAKQNERVPHGQPMLNRRMQTCGRINPNTTMTEEVSHTEHISLHRWESNIKEGLPEIVAI